MESKQPSHIFWVGEGNETVGLTAEEVLRGMEEGRFAADTPVGIQPDAIKRPLARYVRELVWLAHQRHTQENTQTADRTLFEAAFERAPIGVVLSDLAGRLVQANDTFCKLLGYSLDEIIGLRVGQLSESADRELEIALGNELLAGKRNSYQIEKRFKTRSGEAVDTYTAISVVRDPQGAPLHVIAHIMDLTPLNKLKKSREIAEAESRAKSAFLSSMSHEIRTPMNAILGYAQLLHREEGLSERQRGYLDTIDRSGKHLLALINGVLDMAKIESGQEQAVMAEVNLRQLLVDIERMFVLRTSRKGLALTVRGGEHVPAIIRTDAGKLRQILINLIGNAVKFTDYGCIDMQVTLKSVAGKSRLLIRVTDTGCGIEAEQLNEIFSAFKQVGVGQNKLGTGLGLSVSREYARLLGGDLTATSELGSGSVFHLEMDVDVVAEELLQAPGQKIDLIKTFTPTPTIMVVDDVVENRMMLLDMLRSVGLLTTSCASGQEALKAIEQAFPSLVLLDLRMPEMDGMEVLRRLRKLEGGERLPVVIVSASVLDEEKRAVLDAGADAFVPKPILQDELFAVIVRLLHRDSRYAGAPLRVPNRPKTHNSTLLEAIPLPLLTALRDAARVGEMIKIEQLQRQVEPIAPVVAEKILVFAVNFEYEQLIELLDEQEALQSAE